MNLFSRRNDRQDGLASIYQPGDVKVLNFDGSLISDTQYSLWKNSINDQTTITSVKVYGSASSNTPVKATTYGIDEYSSYPLQDEPSASAHDPAYSTSTC